MIDQADFASSLHSRAQPRASTLCCLVRPRWRTLLVLCCALVGSTSRVRAEDQSNYNHTVERAVSEFSLGNWEEAHALFRRAHELSPNARSWRGLGVCAFELRHYVEAVADLEAALLDPRKPLTTEQRDEAKRLLLQAREFVSAYHLRVLPADAQVLVDGKPAALNHDILQLDPGPHSVVVRAAGYEERRAEFRAGAGVTEELSIELSVHERIEPESEQGGRAHADASASHERSAPSRRRRVWTFGLAGGAVAAAAVAVALRLRVNGIHSDYNACLEADGACGALKHHGQRLQRASYGVAGLAGVLAVGVGVAFALEGRERPEQTVALQLSPTGLQLRGSF